MQSLSFIAISVGNRRVIAALCFAGLLSYSAALGALSQKRGNQSPAVKEGTLVCALSGDSDGDMSVDPVVMVRGGRLEAPYSENSEAAQAKFAKVFFSTGKRYRLLFGGGEVGTATIKSSDTGCNNIHATASVETTAKIHGQVMALATNGESLGKRPSSRRAPSDEERAAVMELVKRIYSGKGTTARMLRSLETTNLTATDLDGDGRFEIIGSFEIAGKDKTRRDLFLIAEPQAAGYKASLAEYQFYKLPPEGFDSAIKLVDQLDVDGDGNAEVFATQAGFDAYAYLIYKKRNGRWVKVYSAMGDAC